MSKSESFTIKQVGSVANQHTSHRENPQRYRVYLPSGLCPALNTMGSGGRQPCIVVEKAGVSDV